MVAFLTVHKMTKRQPAKKATGAFMAVANRHIYPDFSVKTYKFQRLLHGEKGPKKNRPQVDPRPPDTGRAQK